jgi:light-independent protochlorophyllide reductase subunit B
MYQGTAHYGVARITNSLRNVQAVFHAPLGDDYINTVFTMLERTPDLPRMHTSVVTGRDLAQGTIRLPERLRQIEARYQPDLIVVAASCSTILLQEDLERVAESANISTEILVYDANPYRMEELEASEGLFTTLVKRYAREQQRTATPSVNILGTASLGFHARSDLIALRRLLEPLGIQVNVVAPWSASLPDLARLPAAWVTIAPYRELGQAAAHYLSETFNVPALGDAPMGVQPTLAWLEQLIALVNEVGNQQSGSPFTPLTMPPLTAFSLDGLSTPSSVPWFARTADMESFSSKTAFVFGDATHTVGMVKFLRNELGMEIAGAGTYVTKHGDWVRSQLDGYVDNPLITETFQDVADQIEATMPDIVCGTQMERHSSRKLDVPCMVISSPTHIENNLLGYYPMLGFAGADVIADRIYTSAKLGMEKHLIDMFGDAGLEYEEPTSDSTNGQETGMDMGQPIASSAPVTTPQPMSSGGHGGSYGVGGMAQDDLHIRLLRGFLKPITKLVRVPMPTPAAPTMPAAPHVSTPQHPPSPAPAPQPAPTTDGGLVWAADAEAMLKKIPAFVRGKVRKNTEQYAQDNGHTTITAEVLRAAKEAIGG